jgi:hypothetical protein
MVETRKLAAILAADVVGFSRLAGIDEDRTLARLRALRSDLIDPTVALHHGRVVKRTGDGSIVEFRSVVDAVRCAIEVQNGMVERNAGLHSDGIFNTAYQPSMGVCWFTCCTCSGAILRLPCNQSDVVAIRSVSSSHSCA